jgi:hypothetical protein
VISLPGVSKIRLCEYTGRHIKIEFNFIYHHFSPLIRRLKFSHPDHSRHLPTAHFNHIKRLHCFDQFTILVPVLLLHQYKVIAYYQYFLTPDDCSILIRVGLNCINNLSVLIVSCNQAMFILIQNIGRFADVLIGKITAHPTLIHHRRRNFYNTINFG